MSEVWCVEWMMRGAWLQMQHRGVDIAQCIRCVLRFCLMRVVLIGASSIALGVLTGLYVPLLAWFRWRIANIQWLLVPQET